MDKGASAVPTFAIPLVSMGTRSLSSGARSRDPLALPTLLELRGYSVFAAFAQI